MTGRALITGIAGFTGRYVASSLEAAGYEVFGSSLEVEANANSIQADLCDLESMRKLVQIVSPDVVMHMGAISYAAYKDTTQLYMTNIVGSRHLLHALSELEKPPKAVMLVSSAHVYGNVQGDVITEASHVMPINDYAVSKLAMENMSVLWKNQLPIFIVRPFNYTGHGQSTHFLIPKIIDHYARGAQSIALGNLDVYREFNDVRVVADIYQRLIDAKPIDRVVNICSGLAYSLSDVIGLMNRIAGYEINVKIDPCFVRHNEIKVLRGSNELLERLIGPVSSTPLEETLHWMFDKRLSACE